MSGREENKVKLESQSQGKITCESIVVAHSKTHGEEQARNFMVDGNSFQLRFFSKVVQYHHLCRIYKIDEDIMTLFYKKLNKE